jgi:cytochrome bd-type quinol oxidase subunit 2
MIQRIQTIYLLVVAVLQTVLLFSVQATIIDGKAGEEFFQLSSNWQWAALAALTVLLPLVTIFLFKNRRLQIRLSIINALLLLTLQIVIVYFLLKLSKEYGVINYSVTDISPAISLILTILAIRFIIKDEVKVRAYNRIRK